MKTKNENLIKAKQNIKEKEYKKHKEYILKQLEKKTDNCEEIEIYKKYECYRLYLRQLEKQ